MEGRDIFDRDYARASLLQAQCEELLGLEVTSLRSGLDAINRLETRNRREESDFKREKVEDLCPYDYLDSLDFECGLLEDTEHRDSETVAEMIEHASGRLSPELVR